MIEQDNLVQIQPRNYTSRSAVLTYKTCHYKRYLAYELDDFGFIPEAQSLDLLNGSVIHKGLRHLFEHCRQHEPDEQLTEGCIDEAVEVANIFWKDCLSIRGLKLKSSAEYERLDWIIAEQECLWEGLIRAFALHRLPAILEEYEILEVEREEVFENFSPLVTFLGAADGLFLRKRDMKLVVLSIKSTSEFADVTERDILHDMQGVSESFLVQERLDREFTDFCTNYSFVEGMETNLNKLKYFQWCVDNNTRPKVFAVQYEYLIKGRRREDPSKSGIYKQQSFLCHPLIKDSLIKLSFGVNAGASTKNPNEYKWQWGQGKYPKGWEKGDIWNDIGIKNWVNLLNTCQIQSENGHPFDQILRTPDLVVRSEREIQEWLVSTRFQEEQIVNHLQVINQMRENIEHFSQIQLKSNLQEYIWKFFDKNTQSCHNYYGGDCSYVRHCHDLEPIEDMIVAGELIPRVSHHEQEREEQVRRGFIQDE